MTGWESELMGENGKNKDEDIEVCSIAVLDNFSYGTEKFGNLYLEIRYRGILRTCGMRVF